MMHLKPPVMCDMSCVRCHMSLFNLSQTVRAKDLQFSQIIHYTLCVHCHMSGVTYQVSHVRCHMSLVMCHVTYVMCHVLCVICNIYFFSSKWLSWLDEALLSTGPTPSSFSKFFLLKTCCYLIFTYLGLYWGNFGN